jgi:hypothetical protein
MNDEVGRNVRTAFMRHSSSVLRVSRVLRSVAVAAVFVTATPPAFAQSGSGQVLYDEGVTAYGNKSYDVACAKFEASYQAEQAAAALFMLGKCERARGKWLAARSHFQKVTETEKQDAQMVEHARTEGAELASLTPRVTLRLAPSAPAASAIALDGKAVRADVPTEVDPGEHEVTVTAEGHAASTRKVTLAERQVLELEVSPGARRETGGGIVESPTPARSGASGMRTAGIVITSVGAALAATAIVTSVWIAAGCDGESEGNTFGCPRDGDGYASPYGALMPINAVGWIGGVVGLGVGIPLIIAGGASDDDVEVVVTPAGASLRGRF